VGATAVQRPTIAIISDDPSFAEALTSRWLLERDTPAFMMMRGDFDPHRSHEFDLAVVGRIAAENFRAVVDALNREAKPLIVVSSFNGHSPYGGHITVLPEVAQWPDLVLVVAQQILQWARISQELDRLKELNSELQNEASLGRYILEVRHNLNNALTSVLGNSDLILLDEGQLSPALRSQVETIRNMGMRMNEILQRFSSLQKEMQLVEQQSFYKPTRVTAAGA
jgi:signal transduction histidine kinase